MMAPFPAHLREQTIGNRSGMRRCCALDKQIHFQCSEPALYFRYYGKFLAKKRSLDIRIFHLLETYTFLQLFHKRVIQAQSD